jgi:hypothetical protein
MRMLGQYHGKDAQITKIRICGIVPVDIAEDGTPMVAAAIDYAYWDKARGQIHAVQVTDGNAERAAG